MSRALDSIARQFADANSARISAAASTGFAIATVKTTSPLVVTWRGGDVPARQLASYTAAVGHTVLCGYTDDNQLVVLGRII